VVIAVGDCAVDGGAFAGGYGVVGSVADVIPVDVRVPGCPPSPAEIIAALRTVTGR
jgi:Ni,Fe-hydrogenase III small subunit